MPPGSTWRNRIALRIDVDLAVGLRRGVPFMLDVLGEHGMKATFFVATGGRTGLHFLPRFIRRDYWSRYRRLGLWRIFARIGVGSVGSTGDRLARSRDVLVRILSEGHELGVHGFDHSWWAAHVWSADDADLEREIDRAYEAFRAALGTDRFAWASPNWRTTDGVLGLLHRRGAPYLCECWGREPFTSLTRSGREIPVPHLPVTLPCLESLRITQGLRPEEAVAAVFRDRPPDRYDLLCMHAYYEGLLERDVLRLFLAECGRRSLRTVTLKETAKRVAGEGAPLPGCRLTRGPLPGFVGDVSRQETAPHEA